MSAHSGIEFFGKLPQFGDFVGHNASGTEIGAFDEWLQEGIYAAKATLSAEWDSVFRDSPTYSFVFSPAQIDRLTIGVYRPSQDKAGRNYPFIVSTTIENRRSAEYTPLIPLIYTQFFNNALRLVDQAILGLEPHEITEKAKSMSLANLQKGQAFVESYKIYLQTTTLDSFWRGFLKNTQDPKKYLLFKNLTEIMIPLRSHDPQRLTLGLRFPLTFDTDAYILNVCFWTHVCFRLLGNDMLSPNLFWMSAKDVSKRYLFLFLRKPPSKAFISLVQDSIDSDSVCKLDEDGMERFIVSGQETPLMYQPLLESNNLILKDFLRSLE